METTTTSIFLFVFWACVGGLVVLAGLLMEVMAERKWFKNINEFRRWTATKRFGEWTVIAGIVIEIIVAGLSALHAWENDLLRKPISEMTAHVSFRVKEEQFSENPRWGDSNILASILLCDRLTNINGAVMGGYSRLESLDAENFTRFHEGTELRYAANFHRTWDEEYSIGFFRKYKETPGWALSHVKYLLIIVKFLPSNAEILNGSAEVTINSGPELWFDIPPQKDLRFNAGKIGLGYMVIATNITVVQEK